VRIKATALLAVSLPLCCLGAPLSDPMRQVQLTEFCAAARVHLRHDALNPVTLGDTVDFVWPTPTVVMGQKVRAASRRLALQGTVLLGLVVNSVGRTAFVAVIEKSEHQALDDEASAILRDADFSPATLGAQRVRSCMLIRVTFKVGE